MSRALGLVVLALAACGKIYVDPVSLEAKAEPPAVMLVFDKSGSMAAPLDGGSPCGTCVFPACDESLCPTRMGVARAWATQMLGELGADARWGLTVFPADNVCGAAGTDQVLTPVPETPGAGDVAMKLQVLAVGGGTPTAASVAFAGRTFPSGTAERIIVLFTDGDPNCNTGNPHTCVMPAQCRCTLYGGNCGTVVNDADPNNFCRRGCLDEDGTVDAIRSLAAFGVSTTVVAFGPDVGVTTVDAMAQAGLFGSRCAEDTDCHGYRCAGGACSGGALLAPDAASLPAVTEALRKRLEVSARCRWSVLAELAAGPTSIELGERTLPVTEYVLETPTRVRFIGAACKALLDDATLAPRFFGQP